jgi:hypothetical protein
MAIISVSLRYGAEPLVIAIGWIIVVAFAVIFAMTILALVGIVKLPARYRAVLFTKLILEVIAAGLFLFYRGMTSPELPRRIVLIHAEASNIRIVPVDQVKKVWGKSCSNGNPNKGSVSFVPASDNLPSKICYRPKQSPPGTVDVVSYSLTGSDGVPRDEQMTVVVVGPDELVSNSQDADNQP